MADLPGNKRPPCFCFGHCPPETRPYWKYLVKLSVAIPFTKYFAGVVYLIDQELPAANFCRWKPIHPVGGFATETIIKESVAIPADPFEYNWAVHIDNGLGASFDFFNFVTWDPDNAPFDPDVLPACSAQDIRLVQPGFPTPPLKCAIRPVPEWVCTDLEGQTWDQAYPLP